MTLIPYICVEISARLVPAKYYKYIHTYVYIVDNVIAPIPSLMQKHTHMHIKIHHKTGNFCGRKFSLFCDSMYYANISRFLFSQLEVTTEILLLSNSPTCELNRTHGG